MSTSFRKPGFASRIVLLLAIVMAMFAAPVSPVSAARSVQPTHLTGTLSVYVFDSSSLGKGPIYAAAVTTYDMSGAVVLKGSTNKSGWFTGELKEGKYQVTVSANGYMGNESLVAISNSTETVIKMPLSKELVVKPGVLTLHAWDSMSPAPKPLAGATVIVLNSEGKIVAKGFTTMAGYFTVSLPAGHYKYIVTATGYKPVGGEATIVSEQETVAEIAMSKEVVLGQVQIGVYDGMSSRIIPIANAVIIVYNVDGQLITKGVTDRFGKYGTTLNPGLYMLEVRATGYETERVTATIEPGQTYVTTVYMKWEPVN